MKMLTDIWWVYSIRLHSAKKKMFVFFNAGCSSICNLFYSQYQTTFSAGSRCQCYWKEGSDRWLGEQIFMNFVWAYKYDTDCFEKASRWMPKITNNIDLRFFFFFVSNRDIHAFGLAWHSISQKCKHLAFFVFVLFFSYTLSYIIFTFFTGEF